MGSRKVSKTKKENNNRPSPSKSATEFKEGTKMRGNDGNLYEVVLNKNGVKRWRKFDSDFKIDGNKILIKTTRKDGSIYWKWDPSLSVEDLKTGKRRPFNDRHPFSAESDLAVKHESPAQNSFRKS